jgi:hypothetical protein
MRNEKPENLVLQKKAPAWKNPGEGWFGWRQ